MTFQFNPLFLTFNIFAVIVVFLIAAIIWSRRPAPGAIPLSMLLVVVIAWIAVHSLMVAATDLSDKVLLAKVMYFLTVFVAITWLCFALDYTGSRWWRYPRNISLLLIIPGITAIILVIDSPELLEWLLISPDVQASDSIIVWQRGPFTLMQFVYIVALLVTGTIKLCQYALLSQAHHLRKVIAILIATLIPIVTHAMNSFGYFPVEGWDFMPFALTLAGIVYAIVIFRFHFLDIIPLARSALVENIPDGILVLNLAGYIADLNPAASRIMGVNQASALEKRIETVCPWLNNLIFVAGHQPQTELISAYAGSSRYLEINITPLLDRNSSVSGQLVILKDVTEKRKLAEQLQDLYEKEKSQRLELEAEAQARGLFIEVLGHELRTPLTPVVASADMLKDRFTSSPESVEGKLTGSISDNAKILVQRLDELLELGSWSRGEIALNLQTLDAKEFINEAAGRCQPTVQAKDQTLNLCLANSFLPLEADPSRMEQALVSLLSAASRSSPEGGKVNLSAKQTEGGILVEVHNQGEGLSPEEQNRLFQPYHRIEQYRTRHPGLGLELAICKFIIEAHRGKIWVTSQPGQGSTFSFLLPVKHLRKHT